MHSNTEHLSQVSSAPRLSVVVRALALASASAMACLGAAHAFDSGSTGEDGVLNPAVTTEITLPPSGILQYTSVNIPSGVTVSFKRNALNTPVQLLVSGDVTIAGTISLNGKDAKPTGTAGDGALGDDGLPGEGGPGGFDGGRGGKADAASRLELIRGGTGLGPGGGKGGDERKDGCYGGVYRHYQGLGAAYAVIGGNGYGSSWGCGSSDLLIPKSYGTAAVTPLIGGSGGGGGLGGSNYSGSGGGGGGGAILIASSGAINISGVIDTTGGDGGDIAGTGAGSSGAGGSGGAIKLMASAINGKGSLYANGGCRTSGGTRRYECDKRYYGASEGRIRLEADSITFSGKSDPTYTRDMPGAVSVANAPSIRIVDIAGTPVPDTPTGNADVVLPETITNPVVVKFATSNVPTGNTIKLRVVPARGPAVEVLSPAISGSAQSGTASVSVELPQGPSVLQAITSYTVTVAQAQSLSRFAENEQVERVDLVATLGQGGSVAEIVTVSGKRYPASLAVLQLAGLAG